MNSCPRCSRTCPESAFTCGTCADAASADLLQIGDFLAWADDKRARFGSRSAVGKGTPSAETPLPYDPRVTKVTTPVEAGIVLMAGKVAHEAALVVPAVKVWLLSDVAEWLAHQTGHLTRLHWSPEAFDQIKGWRGTLERLYDHPPEKVYLGRCNAHTDYGPCPASLYVEATEAAHANCPTCGTAHDVEGRRAELVAGVEDYLGTVKEISRLLRLTLGDDVSERMIRGMVDHGLVFRRGERTEMDVLGRRRDSYLLRIGDVQAAVQVMHVDRAAAKGVKAAVKAS